MARGERAKSVDGEYWFSARYAAELLGTNRKIVEAMAIRELVRSLDPDTDCYIAEADVTRLRRDADALKAVKEAAKLPPVPKRGEQMPDATIYAGENSIPGFAKGRIGHPLKDQGHSKPTR